MKKVERINTIMRYINNRAHFTISEIMEEFNISRSTAIRDINEIEALGLPLVAEVGRSGGYSVMRNTLLPAVQFNDDEVKALFIALLATKNQQLPYLKSRVTLTEKLLGLITMIQQDDLILLNELMFFEQTNPNNPDLLEISDVPHPILEKLIQTILMSRYILLTLASIQIPIYILQIYQQHGVWEVEGFHLTDLSKITISVSEIEEIEVYNEPQHLAPKQITKLLALGDSSYNLIVELGPKALKQYRKYHPFKARLAYTHPYQLTAICKLAVNMNDDNEVEEITNWLLFLGSDCRIKEIPKQLQLSINNRIIF